ncbi:MAG: hypothetical protein AAFY57_19385 [Cyanobacteria bacterium J06642_2]
MTNKYFRTEAEKLAELTLRLTQRKLDAYRKVMLAMLSIGLVIVSALLLLAVLTPVGISALIGLPFGAMLILIAVLNLHQARIIETELKAVNDDDEL